MIKINDMVKVIHRDAIFGWCEGLHVGGVYKCMYIGEIFVRDNAHRKCAIKYIRLYVNERYDSYGIPLKCVKLYNNQLQFAFME